MTAYRAHLFLNIIAQNTSLRLICEAENIYSKIFFHESDLLKLVCVLYVCVSYIIIIMVIFKCYFSGELIALT